MISCQDGKCKISDFEYAKPYELPQVSDEKVGNPLSDPVRIVSVLLRRALSNVWLMVFQGTPPFMAIEVQRGRYLHSLTQRSANTSKLSTVAFLYLYLRETKLTGQILHSKRGESAMPEQAQKPI